MTVCWLGNAGWRISPGPEGRYPCGKILIDPDLEPGSHRITLEGIPDDCVKTADAVLITHEHGDHFNIPTARRLVQESGCVFVLPKSCMNTAKKANIPPERIITARHGEPVEAAGVNITPTPAIHGHILGSIYKHYDAADCGYLLSFSGISLFHPGDSVLLQEHLELPGVDVLIISPTEHNTHVRQSKVLIDKLKPKYIFPQHRDTYHINEENSFWTRAYDKELYEALSPGQKERFHTLAQGREFEITEV